MNRLSSQILRVTQIRRGRYDKPTTEAIPAGDAIVAFGTFGRIPDRGMVAGKISLSAVIRLRMFRIISMIG